MATAPADISRPKVPTSFLINNIQSLQCPICFILMTEPKLLSCGHSFCYKCLSLMKCQTENIACPLCRAETNIDSMSVSELPTNLAFKSIIAEVTNVKGKCDYCDGISKPCDLSYCYDCNISLCSHCMHKHKLKSENAKHVFQSHHSRSMPSLRLEKSYCCVHDTKVAKHFCVICQKCICEECLALHKKQNHEIEKISDYVCRLHTKAARIERKLRQTNTATTAQSELCDYLKHKTIAHIDKVIGNINSECKKSMQKIEDERLALLRPCLEQKKSVQREFDDFLADIKESHTMLKLASLNIQDALLFPFDDALNKASKLAEIDTKVNEIMEKGQKLAEDVHVTMEQNITLGLETKLVNVENLIGELKRNRWVKETLKLTLPQKSMTCTAVDRRGRTFVGYFKGGVEIFSDKGAKEVVDPLKEACVMAMAFTSDGILIIRSVDDGISVYGHSFEHINVKFKTIGYEAGGLGDLAVDRNDDIYVSYRDIQKVYVFKRIGGNAFREIQCKECNPQQISVMLNDDIVVMNAPFVKILNSEGEKKSEVFRKRRLGYPAVSSEGKLYVAWVNHEEEQVEMARYTNDVTRCSIIHIDRNIDLSGRRWYCFQAVAADKLVFCTPKELHIFTLDITPYEHDSLI